MAEGPILRSAWLLARRCGFDKVGCDQPVLVWLPNPTVIRRSIVPICSARCFFRAKSHLLLYRFRYHIAGTVCRRGR